MRFRTLLADIRAKRHLGSIQSAEFQYPQLKKGAEQVAKSLCDAGKTADGHYYANEATDPKREKNQIDAIRSTIDLFDTLLERLKMIPSSQRCLRGRQGNLTIRNTKTG